MTDADKPAEKSLIGIRGWLLLYVIQEIFVTLATVLDVLTFPDLPRSRDFFIDGSLTIAIVIGLYLIFGVRKPITRIFHIWLNIIWVGYWAFINMESGELGLGFEGMAAVIPSSIWVLYWMASKRVWATYCQDAGQSE